MASEGAMRKVNVWQWSGNEGNKSRGSEGK